MAEADAFSASLVRVADEVRLTEDALPAEFLPFAEVLPVDVFLAEDALFLPEVRLLADADFRPAVFFTVVREERLRVFPARPLFDEVFFFTDADMQNSPKLHSKTGCHRNDAEDEAEKCERS